MKWLVRPKRYEDESASGHSYRLAEANGFYSLKRWQNENSARRYFGLDDGMDKDQSDKESDKATDNRYTLIAYQRICPVCMQQNPYIRAIWDHALLPCCLVHRVKLVCFCPKCKSILRREPGRVEQCTCGLNYSEITPTKASPSSIEFLLARKLGLTDQHHKIGHLAQLSSITTAELINLIMLLGTYSYSRGREKPRKVAIKFGTRNVVDIVLKADEILSEWPANFHAVLSMTYSRYPSNSTLDLVFGYFYKAIFNEFNSAQFNFLRIEFERWVQSHWKGHLTQRHTRLTPSTRPVNKVLPITTVSKDTGVRAKYLESMVASGKLRGSTRSLPSGRKTTMIEPNQEQKIFELTQHHTLEIASELLGIKPCRLRTLLDERLIFGISPKKGGVWTIPQSEIERFRAALARIRLSDPCEQGRYCTINYVFRFLLSETDSITELFSSILSGEIDCRRIAESKEIRVSGLLINKNSLRQWQQHSVPGISVQDLAIRLRVKQEVVYHLVRKNLIPTTRKGRLGAFVRESDILEFTDTHMWARDIAELVETSPRKVIQTLRSANVEPVAGPDIDGCRQYLFLRKSVSEARVFFR